MQKKFILTFLVLLLALGVSGISLAQEGEPIKVGAIFDLSGPTADVGTPYSEGFRAYVDWVNSNGGIEGRPIELLWQDYAYEVPNAETLYTQFVEEGAVFFHGWGTGDTEALVGRIAEDEIPFVSASYSDGLNSPGPEGEAPYNFLVGTTYSDQLVIMLHYTLEQWLAEGNDAAGMNVVVFHNDSPFGTSPLEDGAAFAEDNGIGSFNAIPMPRGATDFTAELTQAQRFGMTHLIIQNTSGPAATLLLSLQDNGILGTVSVGCLNWCADENLVNLAGDAAEGVLGALPFAPVSGDLPGFEQPAAYLEAQDRTLEEVGLHYTQGWWSMAIMSEGLRLTIESGEELTGPNILASLESMTDFETGGISAPISFTPEDHRGNRSVTVSAVEDGVWVAVSDVIDLRTMEAES